MLDLSVPSGSLSSSGSQVPLVNSLSSHSSSGSVSRVPLVPKFSAECWAEYPFVLVHYELQVRWILNAKFPYDLFRGTRDVYMHPRVTH